MGVDMLFKPLSDDDKFDVIFPPDDNAFQEGAPVVFDTNLNGICYVIPEKEPTKMYILDEKQVIHRLVPPGIDRNDPGDSEYVQEYIKNKKMVDEAIAILAQKLNISSTEEIILDQVIRSDNEGNGWLPNIENLLLLSQKSIAVRSEPVAGIPPVPPLRKEKNASSNRVFTELRIL